MSGFPDLRVGIGTDVHRLVDGVAVALPEEAGQGCDAAGPGELAYFAQVSAVAQALGAAAPLALPRWSSSTDPSVRTVNSRECSRSSTSRLIVAIATRSTSCLALDRRRADPDGLASLTATTFPIGVTTKEAMMFTDDAYDAWLIRWNPRSIWATAAGMGWGQLKEVEG